MSTEPDQSFPEYFDCEKLREWPPTGRKIAVVLWSGFLGAAMMMLALVFAWDPILVRIDEPTWGVLTGAFLIGWVIASLSALMTLALARPPCVDKKYGPQNVDKS